MIRPRILYPLSAVLWLVAFGLFVRFCIVAFYSGIWLYGRLRQFESMDDVAMGEGVIALFMGALSMCAFGVLVMAPAVYVTSRIESTE